MGASNWFNLEFDEILAETDKAFLLLLPDGEEVWIPLSQVADAGDYQEGDSCGEISITEWIARKKGLLPSEPF